MRSDILNRIQELLKQEDLEAIRKDVRSAIDEFRALTNDEIRRQREAWQAEEHEPDEQFEYKPNADEQAFDAAVESFREREREWRKQVAEEQRANLALKEAMLERLRQTIQEEENIGAAFAVFNEVREEWEKVGDVPGDKHKDIHDVYYRLRDEFFYNINIYKELKENDLKINQKKKEDLIEQAKGLDAIEALQDKEKLARGLQKQWLDVGPSPRETYQEMADAFFGMIRPVFDEVKAHYDEIRATFAGNAEAKQALIDELRSFVAEEVEASHAGWKSATDKIIELQGKWKEIGFAGKEHNEEMWQTFRGLADVFFEKKQLFYDGLKAVSKENKDKKTALIEQAEALATSNDWRKTTDAMIALQKEWKAAGACAPGDEQKLWRRFRKAQDTFFKAKKAQFADKEAAEKANLNEKNALIDEIKGFELTGDRKADLDALKEFSSRWGAIGFVPRRSLDELMDRFRAAMDEKYDALSAQRSERSIDAYKQRVDNLAGDDDRSIRREQSVLREKMDRLRSRVAKTEENLERFTGKGAEAIREQYEKSIKADRREMDEIREKLKLLRIAVQSASKEG
jgi:hypothetical protein